MKNRKVGPTSPLVDFKTVKRDVDRRIRRRRTQSSPQADIDVDVQDGSESVFESETNDTKDTRKSFGAQKVIGSQHESTDIFLAVSKSSEIKSFRNSDVRESGINTETQDANSASANVTKKIIRSDHRRKTIDATSHDHASTNLRVQNRLFRHLHNLDQTKSSPKTNIKNERSYDTVVDKVKKVSTILPVVLKAESTRKAASKWRNFRAKKRVKVDFLKHFEKFNLKNLGDFDRCRRNTLTDESFDFLDEDVDVDISSEESLDHKFLTKQTKSKELVHYFVVLARSKDESKSVDLDKVASLIEEGADPNWGDRHGQTILHEVARIWHPDVAMFLLEHGAEVEKVDSYGRSPLHVAAAVDYADMVEFLLANGAKIDARTFGENQTPIHYAAKNDACSSLLTLMKKGASIDDTDFKDRTPLQVAAELDRSETCRILISEGAPAGVWDDSGMSAMSLMIQKMPPVALQALDQFHIKDRANRRQYFYLDYLEPPLTNAANGAKSSLKVAVEQQQFSIITHPVMQRLTEVKWKWFGKMGTSFHFLINLFFCILWTSLLCTLPVDVTKMHVSPLRNVIIRVVFEVFVACTLIYWIIKEIFEYRNSLRERDLFVRWREDELLRDIKYCHPRWPEERAYIEREIAQLADQKPSYLVDWWNFFDWITYGFMLATVICHIITAVKHSEKAFRAEKAVGSVMLILQWARLMKFVRAFKPLGPFVVILRHVISDTGRFAFLFFVFYIPYAAALWILFGNRSVTGYKDFGELAYNLLQITVVGDFGFSDLAYTDGTMARLLCGSYIVVSGIVCLNLFIALLSDTFQRVYDNVQANALMLRSARVLHFEDNFSNKRRAKFRMRLHRRCSPEITYYDDDMTDQMDTELKRMTHQIKADVDNLKSYLENKFGNPEDEVLENGHHRTDSRLSSNEERRMFKEEIDLLKSNYDHSIKIVSQQLLSINSMLANFVNKRKKKKNDRRLEYLQSGNVLVNNAGRNKNVIAVTPILMGDKTSRQQKEDE